MYKYWSNKSIWAELDAGWHFGVGFEITDYPAIHVTLPFLRLSLGWQS